MQHHSKSIINGVYEYFVEVFDMDTTKDPAWMAIVTVYRIRGPKVTTVMVRDDQGEQVYFTSMEQAFEGAEEFIEHFSTSLN